MMRVRAIVLGLMLAFCSSGAWAQTGCQGQPAAGGTCGNPAATAGLPSWATMTALLDRNFGGPSTQGTVLNRGASVWSATATPTLGLNGGTGGQITLNGATSGSAVISVNAVAGSTTFKLPVGNGTNGFSLTTDGSGNTSWTNPASGGTVTSVGLALPASVFTVSGTPVTITGTLTGTLATQSANTVWAGPTTGAASAPTFRSLVGADLPNPSASTLGGVQSFAAVGSQWIRQISTSGVPTASQPAFTDISGVATGAQLPNPSASTLGGVESLAAVASKWINTISTSGVPSATQPIFSDIGGNATLAQLPSIGNGSLLSNISGGTATPLGNSLTSIIDSVIGATQGQVLYRSGTVWTALSPGTAGQVLTTAGAAANPSWTTVTGTGTVTNIATNNGVTGGPITTTGTIGLASISTGNVLANVSGISAAPSATTPTAVLDVIGTSQGSLLYRGASVWTALVPGTNGQFLQTTGAGSTPQWANAVASFNTRSGVVAPEADDYANLNGLVIQNCSLAASVSGSNLTINLVNAVGSTPTATSPCVVTFRSATASTGTTVARVVSSATSLVFNSGSNLGSANNVPFKLWIEAIDTGSTAVLAASNQSNPNTIFPFPTYSVITSTACNACASATSAGVFYSTATQTSKAWSPLGWMEWGSGLATAGTWASGPTTIQLFGPGMPLPGQPVPNANEGSTSSAFANSANAYAAVSGCSATISPTLASNPVSVSWKTELVISNSGAVAAAAVIRSGTVIGKPTSCSAVANTTFCTAAQTWTDAPGTTSSTTWTVNNTLLFGSAGTATSPNNNGGCSVVAQEVMG